MANNTYIGGEIKLIEGLSDLFAIDSKIVRYTKADNQEISVQEIIKELLERIGALENSKVFEVQSVTLTNLSCPELSSAKTIPASGGTFTITSNSGYSLPSEVSVTNATPEWNQSTGVLKISNVIGDIIVSASAVANAPTSIKIYNEAGTSELDLDQTIIGTNGALKIKVNVTSDKTLIKGQSQFKVTEIPTGITVKYGSTKVTTSMVLDSGTILTISGNAVMSAVNNLTVTTTAKNISDSYISDSLGVKVEEGSISRVTINPTSHEFTANGASQTFTATLSHNMFNSPDISKDFIWTIGGTDKDMFSGSSTSNSISITASKNTDTVNKKSATLSVRYGDVSNEVNLTINKQSVSYYWHVGSMTEADALNPETLGNIVNGKNATSSTTGISTVTIPNDAANEVIVFVYPEIWGRPTIKSENGFGTGDSYYKDEGFELPAGYNASFWPGDQAIKGKTLKITWSK